ncbi:MAG: twin-arginine translocation signal domain-containing protein [Thaumarchaeota archaeon]|nr:twin-arginine translocation signal domain-containing protein [Nitrososphaerota archaeon]
MSEQCVVDKNGVSKRDFLKLLTAGGVALAFTPFIQWGKFMPNPDTMSPKKAQVTPSDGTFSVNFYSQNVPDSY